MTTAKQLMTADEFYEKYNGSGPGKSELWYGEVRTMAPVGYEHGDEAGGLIFLLQQFTRAHRLGFVGPELGCVLAPALVLAPDVAFIEAARRPPRERRRRFFEGHPNLAIEVLSPDDTRPQVARKVATYLEYGTPRVWVVDADLRTVIVHRPGRDPHTHRVGDTLTSDDAGFSMEGFALQLSELFSSEE